MKLLLVFLLVTASPALLIAQRVKVLTNQVGYEDTKFKRAVIVTGSKLNITAFRLINDSTGKIVYSGKPIYSGPVDKWKLRQFWTINFSSFTRAGTYRLEISTPSGPVSSHPFLIGKNILEKATLSD